MNNARLTVFCAFHYINFESVSFFDLVDDARLLLGIYYHGYGNWEKIRLDTRFGLTKKIAPVTLGERETFLPRAPNLDNRASALLQKVFCTFIKFLLAFILLYIFL